VLFRSGQVKQWFSSLSARITSLGAKPPFLVQLQPRVAATNTASTSNLANEDLQAEPLKPLQLGFEGSEQERTSTVASTREPSAGESSNGDLILGMQSPYSIVDPSRPPKAASKAPVIEQVSAPVVGKTGCFCVLPFRGTRIKL